MEHPLGKAIIAVLAAFDAGISLTDRLGFCMLAWMENRNGSGVPSSSSPCSPNAL